MTTRAEMRAHLRTLTDAEVQAICSRRWEGERPARADALHEALNTVADARAVRAERIRAGTWTL